MAVDVYVVGLWDDYMTYWLLDKAEWDKLEHRSMQEGDFTPIASWDILAFLMTPEELEKYKEECGDDPLVGSVEDSLDLNQILQLVKAGVINVVETGEGLQF